MNKKYLLALVLIFLLFAGSVKASGTSYSNNTISIDDLVYDAVLSIEASQLNLTDNPEEQFKILHASSERLLSMVNQTKDRKKMQVLLNDYQQRDGNIWELWENLEGDDAQLVADIILDIKEDPASRLESLAENQFLPEQAREGISKALENQEKAMKKQEEALEKAQKARERAEQAAAAAAVASSFSAPGQAGTTPGQSGETPGQSGSEPPGQAGTTPGQSGSTPGQSGSAPGQSGGSPGQSGSAPGLNKDN